MIRLAPGINVPVFDNTTKPDPAYFVGLALIRDAANGDALWFSDGANWVSSGGGGGSASSGEITANRSATSSDEILINNTSSNLSITIDPDMPKDFGPLVLMQGSTGTIQPLEGAGVTLIGSNRVTALEGQKVIVMWMAPNKYSVQVVG